MTAIVLIALILLLVALMLRWAMSTPLLRTLSIAIDSWADEQHAVLSWSREQGRDTDQPR